MTGSTEGRMAGKVAVITGAASGIGAGTVQRFVAEGARVVVADLQVDAGTALADSLGEAAVFARCNVTDEDQVAGAVDMAMSAFGRLDCMFNNAGVVGVVGPIAETSAAAWDETIDILLKGVFLGTKHAARVLIEQGSGGTIISTSSTAGIMGGLGPHCYTAAKHAVRGLTKSVANELAQHQIRVNAISPGNTATAMTASAGGGAADDTDGAADRIAKRSPLGYSGFPEDIANAALYLASDESKYVSGHTLVVDAGQTSSGMTPLAFHAGSSQILRHAGAREKL
jgi:NAD(P)-dependent dehydrogenase (short-subunit alcohol dehydrogenase family)